MAKQREEKSNYTGAGYQEEQNDDSKNANYQNQKHEWRASDRLEKFQEALDHHAKNGEEGETEFRQRVAEDFRNEKNLLEYPKEERLEHMKTYVETFNNMDHESFRERANAASEIAQNSFKHIYDDFEAVEADNAEKVPRNIQKIFEGENVSYRFNGKSGEIEFDFKDLEQLERIARQSGRLVHVLRQDAAGGGGGENYSSNAPEEEEGKRQAGYSGTAWIEDESKYDAHRRREIEHCVERFKEALLFSGNDPEGCAEKMNGNLERAAEYANMTEEHLKEMEKDSLKREKDYYDVRDLAGREHMQYRLAEMAQDNWAQVYEAIGQAAVDHPEEAESIRMAADALQASWSNAFMEDMQRQNWHDNAWHENRGQYEKWAEKDASEIAGAIRENRALVDSAKFGEESQVEFTEEPAQTLEQFEDIHNRANSYVTEARNNNPSNYSDIGMEDLAVERLAKDMEAGIEYIKENEAAIERGDQYDDGTLQMMYESTANQARAIQHIMGTRPEGAGAEAEQKEAVTV